MWLCALLPVLIHQATAHAVIGHDAMDFWVGNWDVFVGKDKAGTDRVEKMLNGNAIMEHWTDTDGSEGKSLFYFMPATHNWKQVWVTPQGVYKEKVSHPVPGGLQFVGHVFLPGGRSLPDRTTLTRAPNGRVHQVIEYSKDNGKSWIVSFDAIYVPGKARVGKG